MGSIIVSSQSQGCNLTYKTRIFGKRRDGKWRRKGAALILLARAARAKKTFRSLLRALLEKKEEGYPFPHVLMDVDDRRFDIHGEIPKRRCDWQISRHNLDIRTGHIQKRELCSQSQRRIITLDYQIMEFRHMETVDDPSAFQPPLQKYLLSARR